MKLNKPRFLILHHTNGIYGNPNYDSSGVTFEQVNEYHKRKWNFKSSLGYYIAYQYFIDWSGKITQGRADTDIGAHTLRMNDKSIGICLSGNFSRIGKNNLPSWEQQESLRNLIIRLMKKYDIPLSKVVEHSFFSNTDCAGKNITKEWINTLLKEKLKNDEEIKIELLTKQIGILQKLIQIYTKLYRLLFAKKVGGRDRED